MERMKKFPWRNEITSEMAAMRNEEQGMKQWQGRNEKCN